MRSFIIMEVEHDDTTDALDYFVTLTGLDGGAGIMNAVEAIDRNGFPFTLRDYSVRVDLPPYLTAVSLTTHGLPQHTED